ncbi:MAG: GNAT family N-acetyltransferase [Rhizobiaceae bacterium]
MVNEQITGEQPQDVLCALRLNCPVISTGRLLLRPPHADDVEDMTRQADNYRVASMLASMPHPYFAEDAKEFITRISEPGTGACVYAVTNTTTGEFMGVCGIHEDHTRYELPFVGYWLGESFWGNGYATEAAQAMMDLFFKVTDGTEILISCRTDNHASRKVIQKLGGQFWMRGQAFNRALGEIQQLEHYRVNREDWMLAASRRA